MRPKLVSGHQPTLFGTAGYWSKIAVADQHLVTSCAPFRRHDKLASAALIGGGHIAVPLTDGDFIHDVSIGGGLDKTVKSLKMTFGAKRMPYRYRLEPILVAFEVAKEGDSYVSLWLKVAMATLRLCNLDTQLCITASGDAGADTQSRLENRVRHAVTGPMVYVVGPGALDYVDRRSAVPMALHRMQDPQPYPFLYDLVMLDDPVEALRSYTLESVR